MFKGIRLWQARAALWSEYSTSFVYDGTTGENGTVVWRFGPVPVREVAGSRSADAMQLQELNISHTVATGAGLCVVWRANAFDHMRELEKWEDEVGG